MEPVNLYTENFFIVPRLKSLLKKFIHKEQRGPQAVLNGLLAGLSELGVPYRLNDKFPSATAAVCVLSGVNTLAWAISQKHRGRIKKIVAGPTVALPKQAGGIIFNDAIDIFLVPSVWVAEFCDSFNPGFKNKTRVWAAGVKTENLDGKTQRTGCLVYKKNIDDGTFSGIIDILKHKGIAYEIVEYGHYDRQQYLKKLAKTKFMVFLSQSESQGIALNEAWMMDVPTLVWNGSYVNLPDYVWKGSSPAPYLTEQCGMFFSGPGDLPAKLELFLARLRDFKPRPYHLQNFTVAASAQNFIKIIKSLS
jgi:hypothetical protein